MKICYIPKAFRDQSLYLVECSQKIIAEYQAQGFKLTLRQIYYRLVAGDLFPEDRKWRWTGSKWVRDPKGTKNAEPNYKWLGDVVNDARLAGLLDWDAIEDRTRNLEKNPHWESPADIVKAVSEQFRVDLWEEQYYRPEVWVEKDALEGIVESACRPLDVPFFSCRGYTSQTAMWEAAMRMKAYAPQVPLIFHLGDHDPSGIDMSRDIQERLALFGAKIKFTRLALNWKQVEQYNPPPNPAKQSDSRFNFYVSEHGSMSWELDALEPNVISGLIQDAIFNVRDNELWAKAVLRQKRGRKELSRISDNYPKAVAATKK